MQDGTTHHRSASAGVQTEWAPTPLLLPCALDAATDDDESSSSGCLLFAANYDDMKLVAALLSILVVPYSFSLHRIVSLITTSYPSL